MGIKDIIKGITGKISPKTEVVQEQEAATQVITPKQTREYSLEEVALSQVLGIPAGMVANWRSVSKERYLDKKFDCDVMETLREFACYSDDPAEVLQKARDFVGKRFTVEKSTSDRVSISLNAISEGGVNFRGTRQSRVEIKRESRINIPTGNQHEAYSVYYIDGVENISRNRESGKYIVESGVENLGRQIFKPTKDGDYYCTEIRNLAPNDKHDHLLTPDLDPERIYDLSFRTLDETAEMDRITFQGEEVQPGMETRFCLTCSHKDSFTNRINLHNAVEPSQFNLNENSGISFGDLSGLYQKMMNQDATQGATGQGSAPEA